LAFATKQMEQTHILVEHAESQYRNTRPAHVWGEIQVGFLRGRLLRAAGQDQWRDVLENTRRRASAEYRRDTALLQQALGQGVSTPRAPDVPLGRPSKRQSEWKTMAQILRIGATDIEQALSGVTRQYLEGKLWRPQPLRHIPHDVVEIGITRYGPRAAPKRLTRTGRRSNISTCLSARPYTWM
jgi:hypothetical protein